VIKSLYGFLIKFYLIYFELRNYETRGSLRKLAKTELGFAQFR